MTINDERAIYYINLVHQDDLLSIWDEIRKNLIIVVEKLFNRWSIDDKKEYSHRGIFKIVKLKAISLGEKLKL